MSRGSGAARTAEAQTAILTPESTPTVARHALPPGCRAFPAPRRSQNAILDKERCMTTPRPVRLSLRTLSATRTRAEDCSGQTLLDPAVADGHRIIDPLALLPRLRER
jgi:hypothetical protein